jgi:hypothetical protein
MRAREDARRDQTDSPPLSFCVWRSRMVMQRWSYRVIADRAGARML